MNLTLSWRRPLSYKNQSIDLQSKAMDWFLYDNGLHHERVNNLINNITFHKIRNFYCPYYGDSLFHFAITKCCWTKIFLFKCQNSVASWSRLSCSHILASVSSNEKNQHWWKVSKYRVFSGPYFLEFRLNTGSELGKIQTRKNSVFGHFFSQIRTDYGDLLRKSPYLVQILENTDQKKLRTWTLFTQSNP